VYVRRFDTPGEAESMLATISDRRRYVVVGLTANGKRVHSSERVCSECGESDRCEHWPGRTLVERSPQGEDHEAGINHATKAVYDTVRTYKDASCARMARAAVDAYLSRCPSPERGSLPPDSL